MYLSEIIGKGGITARVVTDSISNNTRLVTLNLRYPRFIHSELMTHRMFSRNASSGRATPFHKMKYGAAPIHWGKNFSGMQAKEEINEPVTVHNSICLEDPYVDKEQAWKFAERCAVAWAKAFSKAGYHKQIVNRLTEPFQFINVLVTSTEWDNFFNLREHDDAQPEIRELATVMKTAMAASSPKLLDEGEWHLPFITKDDYHNFAGVSAKSYAKISAARCARVSYNNHDNSDPIIKNDIELADRLLKAGHMSPFEHQATPMRLLWDGAGLAYTSWNVGITHVDRYRNWWSGNFRNWIQFRQML